MDRRRFVKSSLLSTAALSLPPACSSALASEEGELPGPARLQEGGIIDTNVYVGQWPFRRLPEDSPEDLVSMLRENGVTQAWTGHLSGPFHKDIRTLNQRLVDICQQHGDDLLVPFGTINPQLPDWQEDLRICDEEYNMPGIRVHPSYQNYALDDPVFAELLDQAAERNLIVQLVPWMRDERHHHTEMPVGTTDLAPLPGLLAERPSLDLVLLNGFRAAGRLPDGAMEQDNLYVDFAKLDVLLGLRRLLDEMPAERVVFGSFAPMFYFEQAPLKMEESAVEGAEAQALREDNARRLFEQAQS